MKEPWKWYIYIIECKDGTYYTGMTWQPYLRYDQHISGMGSKYTSIHGVKKIVYIEEHENIEEARKREKQIKDWNREKKEKLIKGEWKKEW
ncbi:MAG: GIY-YIG nuclease family protein [Candidatus Omnitrophota bacterium]|jgi:putative endonuclease